jgi:hypothetical protein
MAHLRRGFNAPALEMVSFFAEGSPPSGNAFGEESSTAGFAGVLPLYAEAAPDLFLDIVEQDLQIDDPKIFVAAPQNPVSRKRRLGSQRLVRMCGYPANSC